MSSFVATHNALTLPDSILVVELVDASTRAVIKLALVFMKYNTPVVNET